MVTKYVIVIAFIGLLLVADFLIQKRTGPLKTTTGRHSDTVLKKSQPNKRQKYSVSAERSEYGGDQSFANKPSHIGMR
jgi:hypothetical protein